MILILSAQLRFVVAVATSTFDFACLHWGCLEGKAPERLA